MTADQLETSLLSSLSVSTFLFISASRHQPPACTCTRLHPSAILSWVKKSFSCLQKHYRDLWAAVMQPLWEVPAWGGSSSALPEAGHQPSPPAGVRLVDRPEGACFILQEKFFKLPFNVQGENLLWKETQESQIIEAPKAQVLPIWANTMRYCYYPAGWPPW